LFGLSVCNISGLIQKERRIASPSDLLMARARSRPTQTQPPAAATSRSRLTASCCRSRFVVALEKIVELSLATPKRLREQLASEASESDALLQPKAASAWSAVFPKESKA